jgi:hypothetical protein
MAAPVGSGKYRADELHGVLRTAWLAFAAAALESRTTWPGAPVEVHTGFWGCGAFGGNRVVMVVLQLVAAHLAGLSRLVFHTVDHGGLAEYEVASDCLRTLLARVDTSLAAMIARMVELGFSWGVSDGN